MKKLIFLVAIAIFALSPVVNAQNSNKENNENYAKLMAEPWVEYEVYQCVQPVYDQEPVFFQEAEQEEQVLQGIFVGGSGSFGNSLYLENTSCFSARIGYAYGGLVGYFEYSNKNLPLFLSYSSNNYGLGFEADAYRYRNYSIFFGGYANVGKLISSDESLRIAEVNLGEYSEYYVESAKSVTAGLSLGGKVYFGKHAFASIAYDISKTNYDAKLLYGYDGEYNKGVKVAFGFIF